MRKVVVIEDDPLVAEVVKDILVNLGMEVYISSSVIEGVGMIITYQPDLVFCDIELWEGEPTGLDVIRVLKHNPSTREIKIIAMSAEEDYRNPSFRAGADKFLRKPFTIEEVKGITKELVGE